MTVNIAYEPIAGWPPLAWIALCDRAAGRVRVRHGPGVETRENWFCEAVWAGEFGAGDFDRTDLIVGSGARLRDGRLVFVSSGTTVDRLQSLEMTDCVLVSNSLPCLMEAADASVDPTYPNYYQDFRSITEGLEGYKRTLETSRGAVTLTYFRNLVWDGVSLSVDDKPGAERRFDSFEAYRAFLVDTIARIGRNMAAAERRMRFRALGTVSSGYDSLAVAVLARHAGLEEAICFSRARGGKDDDGTLNARRLGLQVIAADRQEWRNVPEAFAPFGAVNAYGEEVHYAALANELAGSVLFTGYQGGGLWEKNEKHFEEEFERKDPSGLSLGEFRLSVGFIHCPVAFFGGRQKIGVHHISIAPEMAPWDVGGDYSKPIPRRIIEEAGVPRGTFGVSKRAATVVLWNPREGFLPFADVEDLTFWLAERENEWTSIGATSPLAKKRRARFVSVLFAPARPVLNMLQRIPVARRLARRIARLDPLQRPDPLFYALFPWALDRAKARYRMEQTAVLRHSAAFLGTHETESKRASWKVGMLGLP
jgi:hypothetical protein